MSDDELSDDMKELDVLIAEYRGKEIEKQQKDEPSELCSSVDNEEQSNKSGPKDLIKSMDVPMDKILFGDKTKLLKNLEKAVNESVKSEPALESDGEEKAVSLAGSTKKAKKRKPVWNDANDEEIQLGEVKRETKRTGSLDHLKMDKSYKEYLTAKFTRIVNQPKWASLDKTKEEESDDDDKELLRTVGFITKPSESVLSPGHLHLKRLKDLNRATYAEGHINCIQFHPSSTAALVTGEKGVATIYAIDGNQNDKLHNIHIRNFPIRCARILPCGTKAVFGSITRSAYLYDLMKAKETCYKLRRDHGNLSNFEVSPCGRYLIAGGVSGEVHIYEAKTFELIRTLKQNDDVSAICITADSQRILVSGRSSTISIFSIRQQKLEHRFFDDGCIQGGAMDLSPNQRLLATGSREGVVNVYSFDKVMFSNAPEPEKTFLNLTTGINSVRFNHSSELLAFSSSLCQDAVKIAHFPSATVYANFPGFLPKLGNVRTLEFSPNSAYFAMGTKKACPLFRFKHFQNY